MGQSQIAMLRPQRVGRDVPNNHRFAAVSSCPAGSGRWSNYIVIDRIGVGLRQARRRAIPQTIAVQQGDGRKDPTGLALHKSAKAIKDFSERIPFGHPLEDSPLNGEQGFCA